MDVVIGGVGSDEDVCNAINNNGNGSATTAGHGQLGALGDDGDNSCTVAGVSERIISSGQAVGVVGCSPDMLSSIKMTAKSFQEVGEKNIAVCNPVPCYPAMKHEKLGLPI